jgi:hypothetical protein
VFQRAAGKASVPVEIAGISELQTAVFVLDAAGRVIERQELDVSAGAAAGCIEVPEGGWYSLAVRVGRQRQRLLPFGVGDVLVIAGQSNAAGHGDGFIADRSGLVSVFAESGNWALAQSPEALPGPMGAGSAWPVLGELLALSERVPIGFISAAVGGTSTEQWLPGGELYAGLKGALIRQPAGRRVRAVLWHQGESDAVNGFTTERTYQNMAAMINQSRADAGWQVPWYVALASYAPGTPPEQQQATRAAQALLFKMGLALPGPDTDTHVPESMRYDKLHFGQVGLVVHAMLWFRAVHFVQV